MPTGKNLVDQRTIDDFGAQWSRYTENPGWYASLDCLQDLLGPLLPVGAIAGRHVADIGSGSGRIVGMLLEAGAERVVAIEPSDAFYVLERNLADRSDKVELIHDVGEAVGRLRELSYVFSFGVLHHIVDPRPVVRAAYEALGPGGQIVVWLYGFEGNEAYLKTFGALRAVTKRMPDWALSVLSSGLNVGLDVYLALCRFLGLPMRDYMLNHVARLDRKVRKLTIFDQLNPAYAKYYREAEARALIADAGFEDVRIYHRHGYSWTVRGSKPA